MEKLTTMNDKEIRRLRVIDRIASGAVSKTRAAEMLGISRRQMHRLWRAHQRDGAAGIISGKRSQPGNRRYPPDFRRHVLGIVRERYPDFGPTLACEKLSEKHGIALAAETLRLWMKAEGLWRTRRQRAGRTFQPRMRRDCFGELVQIDGCQHHWFENRGPKCTLLVYADDATGALGYMEFVPAESTFNYFRATRAYIEKHGKPVALYSDKHSVFRVNRKDHSGEGITQFGRALRELNIDIICANTPQAKGRVERIHLTLQDRLVKELRLAGAADIESGNALLASFMDSYNAKFAKTARNPKNLHRRPDKRDDLDEAFVWRELRTVSKNLTLQYDRVMLLLEPNKHSEKLRRKQVTVCDYPDGRLAVMAGRRALPYSVFDKLREHRPGEVVENKRLSAVMRQIREMQQSRDDSRMKRSAAAPRRRGQSPNIFTRPQASA